MNKDDSLLGSIRYDLNLLCTIMKILQNTVADTEKLFNAGIAYLQAGEYTFAYFCFNRIKRDVPTLYNMALCSYNIAWFRECNELLYEAERQIPAGTDCRLRDLPEMFLCWEREHISAFSPMPQDAPVPLAAVQVLMLEAEVAYRLRLYGEVRRIASRLGGQYKRIDELIKEMK